MKQTLTVSVAALGLLVLSSCSGKLGSLSADNFTVTPAPLEAVSYTHLTLPTTERV